MMWTSFISAAALAGLAAAQTYTDCDPTKKDCPADPALGTQHLFQFNATPSYDLWETTAGNVDYDVNNGATFTINKQGDSPTIRTKFYVFGGRTEIWMKVAPGKGIVSSVMWLSDDLDEVDWEFLGVKTGQATTNYYSKGVEDYTHGGIHNLTSGSTESDYHNYTTVWTKDSIMWYIDGANVRTQLAADSDNGKKFPQTPMRLHLGIWAGGDPRLAQGTREWAGGDTDYAKGPYSMYVKSIQVSDFSSGKEYTYGDRSGSWASIKIAEGNSTAFQALHKEPEKSVGDKWAALPTGAKIGVYAGGGAVAAVALGTLIFYYLRQRRIGAAEAKRAEEEATKDRVEMDRLKKEGIDPDSFTAHGQEYGKPGTADSEDYYPEKPWGGQATGMAASAGAGALGAMGAHAAANHGQGPRSPPSTYNNIRNSPGPQSPQSSYGNSHSPSVRHASPAPTTNSQAHSIQGGFDFGLPPSRTASPMGPPQPAMRSMSQGMPAAYGGSNSPPQQQMRSVTTDANFSRMGSPAPSANSYGGQQRMQSPGPGPQGYNAQRMQSPGPMNSGPPQQQGYDPRRMQSPGPQRPPQQGSPYGNYNAGGRQGPQGYQGQGQGQGQGGAYW